VFTTDLGGVACEVSVPRRPRAWVVGYGDPATEFSAHDLAYVRVPAPGALAATVRQLRILPETRGIPVVMAGGE
jgi:hypothetical protein